MIARDPLALAEMAALQEEVSCVMRHDLKNQLAIIRSAAYFLKRKLGDAANGTGDPRVPQFFNTIEEHVDRAVSTVDRSSVAAKFFVRHPAPIDAGESVRAAVQSARLAGRVHVEMSVRQAVVETDPTELSVAVRCLVENAGEAMSEGGTVIVKCGPGAPGDRVAIEVIDEGGGFAGAAAERATEPFFSTKPGRAGLGLNVAERIAKRYGGFLAIRAMPKGASVALLLPLSMKPISVAPSGEPVAPRILLVDDNEGVRVSLCAVLEDEGYEVVAAASFLEAKRHLGAEGASFAAALLDRHLGDGSGTDLVPVLRAVHPATKLVVLSGSSTGGDAGGIDIDARFDKGGDVEELLATLRLLIGRGSRP